MTQLQMTYRVSARPRAVERQSALAVRVAEEG